MPSARGMTNAPRCAGILRTVTLGMHSLYCVAGVNFLEKQLQLPQVRWQPISPGWLTNDRV
jgi:hypothetical protein